MGNDIQNKLLHYKKSHDRKKKRTAILTALSLAVVMAVTICLMLPAVTMETICGMDAHTHGEECYAIVETPETRTIVCDTENIDAIVIHYHDEYCYDGAGNLICNLPEISEHQHSDSCYTERSTLVCEKAETEGHLHDENCFDEAGLLVCAQEEVVPHTHEESCYKSDLVLDCDIEEIISHIHTDECADGSCELKETIEHQHTDDCIQVTEASSEQVRTCALPEHEHTQECYPDEGTICGIKAHSHIESCFNESGDLICEKQEHEHTDACMETTSPLEDEEKQEPEIIPGENENYIHDPYVRVRPFEFVEDALSKITLTGNWPEDVVTVAKSQLGYRESTTDYVVNEEGRKKGYTFYGDWYGYPYGDWCAMFASFCLDTAEVEGYPLSAGCQTWIEKLSAGDVNLWHPAISPATEESYVPKPGDLIFYDFDRDGLSDHVGIVLELIDESETEPALIKTIEGNYSDSVCMVTHAQAYAGIMGFGELPEKPRETENTDPDTDVRLSAETENGIAITISGPTSSFPYANNEMTLSVYEIDSDEDIISENSVYGQLADDLNLSAEELWSKGIRIFKVLLQHDGSNTDITGPVTVTVNGVSNAVLTTYAASAEGQTWSEVLSVSRTDDGSLQFEAESLNLIGIETAGRPMLRQAAALRSVATEPDTLTVYKVWTDGSTAHAQDVIEVGLVFDDGENDPVLEDCHNLSAANNWTYTFTLQNPMEDNGRLQYSVTENVDGYHTRYSSIIRTPQTDDDGWWVPATSIEDGGTYVFVSEFNGSTYTPAGNHDTNSSSPSYMSAKAVTVNTTPVTIGGVQYAGYLTNVDEAASFTAVEQSTGGYLLQNRYTGRYMDVRGYCPMNVTGACNLSFINGKIRTYAAYSGSIRWLKQYAANGQQYDYTQSTTESGATFFSLYKLISGDSANGYEVTITNTPIDPHQGGVPDTDKPEIYKTIDWLGDDGNNTDTSLRGDEFYRLYLDVCSTSESAPVDLLLVLDNSGSMFVQGSYMIDGKIRNQVLWEVLYDLIPEFLAANPGNRISMVYFSGPAGVYNMPPSFIPTHDTQGNVSNDAWVQQNWTQNPTEAQNSLMYYCKFVEDNTGGGTNYAQALAQADIQLSTVQAGHTPYVLFMSDGVPTYYVQGNGLRGGNGFDTVGMSIQSSYYNVAKRNIENCRQPTIDAINAFKTAHPNLTMSAVSFSAVAQEAHTSIMTHVPANDGFYVHASNTAELREAMAAAFAAASVSSVSVTDELSPYVQIPTAQGAQADYMVTMTHRTTGAVTVLYQNGAVTTDGQGIVKSVSYTAGNGINSTGSVQLIFEDSYVLDNDYRYTLSFNVELTQDAYDEFSSNGYGNTVGDPGTDYTGTNNDTSSGYPGLHSNRIAYVDYKINGEDYTDFYVHPVVQVTVQPQTVDLTITKSVINGDLNESFSFEVVFTDSNGDPFTSIPTGSGYTVDNTTGKITFSLSSGQSVTVAGLPENTTAVIRELSHDGYTVLIKEGNQTLYTSDSGALVLTADREINVVNNAGTVLPETGGGGTFIYTLSGAAIMLSALMFGYKGRRKRERRSS